MLKAVDFQLTKQPKMPCIFILDKSITILSFLQNLRAVNLR